jgi:hypothetical protein
MYIRLSVHLSNCPSIVYSSVYLSGYLTVVNLSDFKSICRSVSLSVCQSVNPFTLTYAYQPNCLSVHLSIHLLLDTLISPNVYIPICMSICLSVHLSIHLLLQTFVSPTVCLSICMSICLSVLTSVLLPVCLSFL